MHACRVALIATALVGLSVLACRMDRTSKVSTTIEAPPGPATGPWEHLDKHERLPRALAGLSFASGLVEIDERAAEQIPGRGDEERARQRCRQGEELLRRNDRVAAIAAYKEAVLIAPDLAVGYFGLGRALLAKGKTEFAIAAFRTAVSIDPQLVDTRFQLACALGMAARWQEAIAEFRHLLDIDSQYPTVHARLAAALYYAGQIEAAIESADAAAAAGYPVPPQLVPLLQGHRPAPLAATGGGPQIGEQVRIDVAGGTYAANETTIAATAATPSHVVAAWNDWRESSGSYEVCRMGVGLSLDGGATWTDFLIRPPTSHTGNEGDPMTAWDERTGNMWVGAIGWGDPGGGIFVARKPPGEPTFDPAVMAREYYYTDKCWMAAGPDPSDPEATRLYIAYNEGVIISTDLGATWTDALSLGLGQGFLPRVGPDGELFIVYHDLSDGVMLWRSFDGGVSFDPAIRIATRLDVWMTGDGSRFPGDFRVPPFNYLAVDPNDGTLYCVYFDTTGMFGGNYNVDLYFSKSTDQGSKWSIPVVINSDSIPPGDQFFPWLEVDGDGRLHLLFYDTRHTVQDDDDLHGWLDAYYATSDDGGTTWAEYRLTPESFDSYYDGLTSFSQFMGDYSGLAVAGKLVFPCYASTQNGNLDIFVNIIALAGDGDFDGDGDVDLDDFASWDGCMTGPASGPHPDGCEAFDLDADNDVDLFDFAAFQEAFTG